MKNSMEGPLKTKNRTTTWSSNPTPGHISRENHNSKGHVQAINAGEGVEKREPSYIVGGNAD